MVRRFAPIAIVGRSCVVPGALSPLELWKAVLAKDDLLSPATPADWRLSPESAVRMLNSKSGDRIASSRGGYVRGFEKVWNVTRYGAEAEQISALDPLFRWALWGVQKSLADAGHDSHWLQKRAGLVLGNLGYPSGEMSRFAEAVWMKIDRPDARNRFLFGLSAQWIARLLKLGLGGFSVDMACASSLYALKIACDKLHDGEADLMVAGGLNAADSLFLHCGFTAMNALSPTGQSRPFHRDADGLVPAQGAAFLSLKRLEDAVSIGDQIYGVIRGIGVSNDGRAAGLLVPSVEGQVKAMLDAYAVADLEPRDVALVECHATGTRVGDSTEIKSILQVFGDRPLALSSLKSNLGHLITAAGVAGLIKTTEALRSATLPPTRGVDIQNAALRESRLRVLDNQEVWSSEGLRRAGVNAFGFGGNNVHVIVEEWKPQAANKAGARNSAPRTPLNKEALAVVALGVAVGKACNLAEFTKAVLGPNVSVSSGVTAQIELSLENTRFPPSDLKETLPQQLILLGAAQEALRNAPHLDSSRTGVFAAMEIDPEVARYGLRWRIEDQLLTSTDEPDRQWIASARDAIITPLSGPARVLGNMPNILANRLNSHFDFAGPGVSVGAGEDSGAAAFALAWRALYAGEIDVALVCAADLSVNEIHKAALSAIRPGADASPGDAAVVLVLQRLSDARRNGANIHAIINAEFNTGGSADSGALVDAQFGHSYAASSVVQIAAAVVACERGCLLTAGPLRPWLSDGGQRRQVVVIASDQFSGATRLVIEPDATSIKGYLPERPPQLYCFSGRDRNELRQNLERNINSDAGPARLAIVAKDDAVYSKHREAAKAWLTGRSEKLPEGVFFCDAPAGGEVAFVFTGAAAAYNGMGDRLIAALPELRLRLASRVANLSAIGDWIYTRSAGDEPSLEEMLRGSSLLSQLHAELTMGVLGLRPAAVLGISSGETNSLFATGAWTGMEDMLDRIHNSGMYERETAGLFDAARRSWGLGPSDEVDWLNFRILCPLDRVRAAVDEEPRVHILIIHTSEDCLIGGDADACRRVLQRLESPPAYPTRGHIVHCPEMNEYAEVWRRLHTRPTTDVPSIRFYTNATGDHYRLSEAHVADNLLRQSVGCIDFPRTVLKAWEDGVRIFIEHGPRSLCTEWISKILVGSPHVAVALDASGRSSVDQAAFAIAELTAAGVRLNSSAYFQRLASGFIEAPDHGRMLRFPAHPDPVRLPLRTEEAAEPQKMELAPRLPEVAPAMPRTLARQDSQVGSSSRSVVQSIGNVHAQSLTGHIEAFASSLRLRLELVAKKEGSASYQAPSGNGHVAQHSRPAPNVLLEPPLQTEEVQSNDDPSRPRGLTFSREQLKVHADGNISTIFGPDFRRQQSFVRQVRMPDGLLLLADRVTGLVGEPGSMGTGSIWTETDVREDSWFLHDGRMPAGLFIEAGQADLFLISYLGADFRNQDQRKYRMLSCDVTFFGDLPKPGDTLCYDIHIDGHAQLGEIRIFLFHFDCRIDGKIRLTMRGGQAGFFSDRELEQSAGVLWDPEKVVLAQGLQLDPPAVQPRAHFSEVDLEAFSRGDAYRCFGPQYEFCAAHTWSPRTPANRLRLLDEVTNLDPAGGPWGRGYLRAVKTIRPDDWFFNGHFKNDPCMPGTLMIEAAHQAISFYLAALGFTLKRDSWRFQPVHDVTSQFRCRGQVTPQSHQLVYELFIREVIAGPQPAVYADVLGTIDGVKGLVGHNVGVRLVPDWPTSRISTPIEYAVERRPAATANGLMFGSRNIYDCAVGPATAAFGSDYTRYDQGMRLPRLPGPPYLFLSRLTSVQAIQGQNDLLAAIEAEYDIPADAWYFAENNSELIPACVLLEAGLQPCGWLASFIGTATSETTELFCRNLDGSVEVLEPVGRNAGTLKVHVQTTNLSRLSDVRLASFNVTIHSHEKVVLRMSTSFGFFTEAALSAQVGLPVSDEDLNRLQRPGNLLIDLKRDGDLFMRAAQLPRRKLMMIDRITGFWAEEGAAGLGRIRAEKDVDPEEWFFKAHFFQDPVMPGTLGLEAMLQLLQIYALQTELDIELQQPHFQFLTSGEPQIWRYRGQVLPHRKLITLEAEITDVIRGPGFVNVVGDAALWVDGIRIYQASGVSVRLVGSQATKATVSFALDPQRDTWINDHRPNYVRSTMPLMEVVNRLAQAAQGLQPGSMVTAVRDVRVHSWIFLDRPKSFRATAIRDGAVIVCSLQEEFLDAAGNSTFESVAEGVVELAPAYSCSPSPLDLTDDAHELGSPYDGSYPHGPAFQVVRSLRASQSGSTAIIDAGAGTVPVGLLNPSLLDALFHSVPQENLPAWYPEIDPQLRAFPYRLESLQLYDATPDSGLVRCEVRPDGFDGGRRYPSFRAQFIQGEKVWAEARVTQVMLPTGPFGRSNAKSRRGFLQRNEYVEELLLSRVDGNDSLLSRKDVLELDWLPGSLAELYRTASDPKLQAREIAIKEYVARRAKVHPSLVLVSADGCTAVAANEPGIRYRVSVSNEAAHIRVAEDCSRTDSEPE